MNTDTDRGYRIVDGVLAAGVRRLMHYAAVRDAGFLASWFVAPDTKQGQEDLDALRQEVRALRTLIEAAHQERKVQNAASE